MKVMHLLATGGVGGIEVLCKNYAQYSGNNNLFVFLWGKDQKICREMQKNGANVIQLNLNRRKLLNTFKTLEEVRTKEKVDVIVIHHEMVVCYLYSIWLKKMKKSNVITIVYAHANAEDMIRSNEKRKEIRRVMLSKAIGCADHCISISDSVKKSLIDNLKAEPSKISVIYNGIDVKRFQRTVDHNSNKILYVGRLIKEKGVQNIIHALSQLPSSFNWSFSIVGDGPYRNFLQCQVRDLNLEDKIFFEGTKTNIPDVLARNSIFIHIPEWQEGFGITIVEAMAAGLLCICGEKGAIPEIVENGREGILVNSEAMLLKVLTSVLSNDGKYDLSAIRENAVEKAKQFDIVKFAKNLDNLIIALKFNNKDVEL